MPQQSTSHSVVPFATDLREFVASTSWRFAKTYAATWPHEYVVRTAENAADDSRARAISSSTVLTAASILRFGSTITKTARFTGRWIRVRRAPTW
jgi:hypothetical protein